jgi:hypothetical protein
MYSLGTRGRIQDFKLGGGHTYKIAQSRVRRAKDKGQTMIYKTNDWATWTKPNMGGWTLMLRKGRQFLS